MAEKPLAPFRVPKGVPPEIRRALRLGKPGRFLKTVKALQLADLIAVRERGIQKVHAAAARAVERSRTPQTRERHFAKLRAAQREGGALRATLDQLSQSAGIERLPPLAGKDVVPVIKTEKFDGGYVVPHESALEWEVGVDYTESVTGPSSNVSFNARIFDRKRRPITELQIREAMDNFAADGELFYREGRGRVELAVRTVSWENWKGSLSYGNLADLENFRNILLSVGDGGLRVGAVKRDEL